MQAIDKTLFFIFTGVLAVQNERQPRNTAQVRHDQIPAELDNPFIQSHVTISATHPAFSPPNNSRMFQGMSHPEPHSKLEQEETSKRTHHLHLNNEEICSINLENSFG